MRYVVVGAGAVGSVLGGLLARRGRPVLLVGRGEHAYAVRDNGLEIRCPDTTFTMTVPVATDPGQVHLRVDDILVLTTKTHQATAALQQWADVPVHDCDDAVTGTAASTLPILTASNGVTSEDVASRWFDRVFAVCVWCPTVMVKPGTVIVRGAPLRGVFHLGRYGSSTDVTGDAVLLDRVGEDWDDADCLTRLPPDVMSWKYRKLLANLGNVVDALVDDPSAADDLTAACRTEAVHVLQAAGITVVPDDKARVDWEHEGFQIRPVPDSPAHLGSSTWQSLERGTGAVETDYLNGEIARLGRHVGIPTPVNAGLAAAARQAAHQHQPPGSFTAADLRARLHLTPRTLGAPR